MSNRSCTFFFWLNSQMIDCSNGSIKKKILDCQLCLEFNILYLPNYIFLEFNISFLHYEIYDTKNIFEIYIFIIIWIIFVNFSIFANLIFFYLLNNY